MVDIEWLADVIEGAAFECGAREFIVGVRREHNDRNIRPQFSEAGERYRARRVREIDVQEDQVWPFGLDDQRRMRCRHRYPRLVAALNQRLGERLARDLGVYG